jgi:L-lysine exporter family protein LysE/ArgO
MGMLGLFFQGLTLGLAYVAPIGMQNMFAINSALTNKPRRAYPIVSILIFFDIALAVACFFGVGALMSLWKPLEYVILGSGSLLVIYIGITLLRAKASNEENIDTKIPMAKVILTAFIVTWANPQAILDGTMLLGANRATMPDDTAWIFLVGVNIASLIWFLGITILCRIFSAKFTPKIIHIINIVCGIVIIGYGVKLLVQFAIGIVKLF